MSAATAILLLGHGARDPEWARPMTRLAEAVAQRLPHVHVANAFLEFMSPTLPAAIDDAVAAGCTRIRVVPVFLAAGGHVKREVPEMIEAAKLRHPACAIEMGAVLGEAEAVIAAMANAAAAGL